MPLTEKELQKQVKKGPEEKKEFEKKFESKEAVKKSRINRYRFKREVEKWNER